jgi:formate hydrogenlyase subunit 3/multisubunit Na+/H+ antiporter MnhD subunit
MLAYSSIGQLGLVVLALAVPGPAGLAAALALGLHHLVVKPALFLLAESWGGPLRRLAGGARSSRLATALVIVLALSLVGVPPLPGFWAKLLLLQALLGTGGTLYALAAAVVLVATVVEAAYLFRLVRALYGPGRPVHGPEGPEILPAALLGALVLLATLAAGPIGREVQGVAAEATDRAAYLATVLGPRPPGGAP